MAKQILGPRVAAITALALGVFFFGATLPRAQGTQDYDADRQRAFELYNQNNFVAALPLLEKLAAAKPDDLAVVERLGFCILANSAALPDPEARRAERRRARQVLLRAKEMGDSSNLIQIVLEGLPEDGSEPVFSTRPEVDQAMREGEAAFVQGDFDAALDAYGRALKLDPNHYEAALFSGDVYYKMKQMSVAGDWFALAIRIDPNRETAYRYWGDALMAEGKMEAARAQFIEAVIAEPYRRASWAGLSQWAQRNRLELSSPKIESPKLPEGGSEATTMTIDLHWLPYVIMRRAWRESLFTQEFPNEKTYRHSLREEADALGAVAKAVAEETKAKKVEKLDPSLATLLEIHQAGLLEAYVLLERADKGIAQDYPAYRAAHRDLLRRYLDTYVVPHAD